jgi:hypothetical protein
VINDFDANKFKEILENKISELNELPKDLKENK